MDLEWLAELCHHEHIAVRGPVDCMETRRITASICFSKSRPGANTSPAHAFL
jgi:hypothetical protein